MGASARDNASPASGHLGYLTILALFAAAIVGAPDPAWSQDTIRSAFKTLITGNSPHSNTTRFKILVPKKVDFTVQAYRATINRVVVKIPATGLVLPKARKKQRAGDLIKSFRGGTSAPGQSRVDIRVTEPVIVKKQEIRKSSTGKAYEIVLELVPASTLSTKVLAGTSGPFRVPIASLGAGRINPPIQPPMPAPAVRPSSLMAKAYKPVVVIDPGHGGRDSGAIKHGTVEKNVVLAFSKELRRQLRAAGNYKVLMTRETDRFVTLSNRRRFAERHNAQLFIAVHADYANRTSANGATIYSLRGRVASRLRRRAKTKTASKALTRKELGYVRQIRRMKHLRRVSNEARAVQSFLTDLAARDVDTTHRRTNLFSKTVIKTMGSTTRLRGKPHRTAAFHVLKTAKVPSVLIELAYVSNRRDAKRLKSRAWRRKVAASIRQAIDNYFAKDSDTGGLRTSFNK